MKLADLIKDETGADASEIMFIRHFNTIDNLLVLGGTVEEFTRHQPSNSKWDYWAPGKTRIAIVVAIVHDRVYEVFRVTGMEAEGRAEDLLSDAHRQFNIERGQWTPDHRVKRFTMVEVDCSAKNERILGWKGSEISPVVRSNSKLFWRVEVEVPEAIQTGPSISGITAVEGQTRLFFHLRRERDPAIALAKRAAVLSVDGVLKCEACGFMTQAMYSGLLGEVCEIHHRLPLSEALGPVETSLKDLAVLCANCHRAIHRTDPLLSVEEFRDKFFKR